MAFSMLLKNPENFPLSPPVSPITSSQAEASSIIYDTTPVKSKNIYQSLFHSIGNLTLIQPNLASLAATVPNARKWDIFVEIAQSSERQKKTINGKDPTPGRHGSRHGQEMLQFQTKIGTPLLPLHLLPPPNPEAMLPSPLYPAFLLYCSMSVTSKINWGVMLQNYMLTNRLRTDTYTFPYPMTHSTFL